MMVELLLVAYDILSMISHGLSDFLSKRMMIAHHRTIPTRQVSVYSRGGMPVAINTILILKSDATRTFGSPEFLGRV